MRGTRRGPGIVVKGSSIDLRLGTCLKVHPALLTDCLPAEHLPLLGHLVLGRPIRRTLQSQV